MPLPTVSMIRRFDAHDWALWLVPAVVAAIGCATLSSAGAQLELLRGLVFVGGPLLLLAGLHARLDGYLHARARHSLLPLPLPPALHWTAARHAHRVGLWWTGGLGAAALLGAALGAGLPWRTTGGLLGDFGWLWLVAAGLEPVIPGLGAWLGRRFPEGRPERRWQEVAGGGWTIPEAVVHLYAPALGVGLATALAMPGQLWIDRFIDGAPAPGGLLAAALVALALAVGLGRASVYAYAQGMFGAVPWVHEAIRTLAGPPVPEAVPRWLLLGRDPMRHLVVRQFWRVTPVPGLRLLALVGGAAWIGLAAAPSVSAAAIWVALAATWVVPGARLQAQAQAQARARLAGPLPLPPDARAGRSWSAWALLCSPVLVTAAGVILLWSGSV